jgi:diguanylate cyclase (GGDEF)-like protein
MPGESQSHVARAGQQLKRKILLALTLSAVVPLLILGYVAHRYVLPLLDESDATAYVGFLGLVLFTVLAMLGGGYTIWDLGRTIAGLGSRLAREGGLDGLEKRRDEVGTLIGSFDKMITTIEQQAGEINSFASRLDGAYKELESTNARLKEFSFRDDVTGLYNRRFFGIRLEEEISRYKRFNHPVSVVMMDLDGFKAINDTLGHAMGDETLREVAQILLRHSRGINVVCRYGGDEFAILLVETSKAGARLYGDRIRQVISTYTFPHGSPITASLGIGSLPDDEVSTSEDLIRASDEALYAAKRAGKNQIASAEDSPERTTWNSGEKS